MHGERDGRPGSSPSPSMSTDETNKSDHNLISSNTSSTQNPPSELAYLPIGCSVSAKYRGAFCSAQVKTIEKQVKLKVTLVDSAETITISEEQIVQPALLRIGNTVTVRLNSSNRRQSNDSNSHTNYARSGLAAFIANNNPDEKQATIKQIIDNSLYTVIFNDGDEKSLRRSSLCLQGIRLYQTPYGQQKILEEVPSNPSTNPTSSSSISPPPSVTLSTDTPHTNANDMSSIVAIRRQGNLDQPIFPALVLKRKALADHIWVRSFVDGREYIAHTRDDVQSFHNNPEVQAQCRNSSKQATIACEKFVKFNQIPAVWQKRKKNQSKNDDNDSSSDEDNSSDNDSSSSESDDDDDIDEETTEEKDSFVAQLIAFMDDRGTPINHIPKVQNYDLDLHRLFKIVRIFGGYNKVTRNDQWDKIHMKMGLPDEESSKNGRAIENAYKKYLFAYEDLTKKLGSMNAPGTYFGGRNSLGNDSRRSLIRVRQQQQQEEKVSKKPVKPKSSPASAKQRPGKSDESRPSADSKNVASSSSAAKKIPPKAAPPTVRKITAKNKPANLISSSSSESESESESETSEDESSDSSSSANERVTKNKGKNSSSTSTTKKPITPASNVSKKLPTPAPSNKSELKKTPTSSKSSAAASNESKQTALTIKIPISGKSKTSAPIQSIKKPSSIPVSNDDKKKIAANKSETKTVSASPPKKSLVPPKTSQSIKTSATSKSGSTNDSSRSSSLASNKTSTNVSTISTKSKISQPQISISNQSKDRSALKSTSSTSDSRNLKLSRPTSSSINRKQNEERPSSMAVKKSKPIVKSEMPLKPLAPPSTTKIPKLLQTTDVPKKPDTSLSKIPKKVTTKEESAKLLNSQEQTSKVNSDVTSKPIRSTSTESLKKAPIHEPSQVTETPSSPPPVLSSASSISEDTVSSMALAGSSTSASTIYCSADNAVADVKPSESLLTSQTIPTTTKESPGHRSQSTALIKRPYPDDTNNTEPNVILIPDADERLSPLKRPRTSISSQESLDTLSSNDQPGQTESLSTSRNAQIIYEEILINDVLLVTWGSHGAKLYPARCIAKNDEKNELFVHYIKYNPRHDEWIKIDRVIERTDSVNGQASLQARHRRSVQTSSARKQHADSTSSNSSTPGNHSNERIQLPSTLSANLSVGDVRLPAISTEDEEQDPNSSDSRVNRTISTEKAKPIDHEESDSDENSQENHQSLEPISSADEDGQSTASTNRTSQSDSKFSSSDIPSRRISISNMTPISNIANDNEVTPCTQQELHSIENDNRVVVDLQDHISKRRQSRVSSGTTRIETMSERIDNNTSVDMTLSECPVVVKEETIDGSQFNSGISVSSSTDVKAEPVPPCTNILAAVSSGGSGHRRSSTRQLKRRSTRESHTPKDSSVSSTKKKTKFENGANQTYDTSADSNNNNDRSSTRSNSTEQQSNEFGSTKRSKTAGRRGGKRGAIQQGNENDDYHSSSPSSITMRQQLRDMFKHKPSRYNFLDINENLVGDDRITHLKDRMRECQKVFFNLKSALLKIEKQRKIYVRKQKSLHVATVTSTIIPSGNSELLSTPTCT